MEVRQQNKETVGYLGLSGEGFGLRGGGVRGTAGRGATEAAGIRPRAMCFCSAQEGRQKSGQESGRDGQHVFLYTGDVITRHTKSELR